MTNDQLGGAFGRRESKQQKDTQTADFVIKAVIGAAQQVLVSSYKFSEEEAGRWAVKVVQLSQANWDVLQPELPPANDKQFMILITQMTLTIGALALQVNWRFNKSQTDVWMLATTKLMNSSAGFAAKEASKRPRKPKVNRDE